MCWWAGKGELLGILAWFSPPLPPVAMASFSILLHQLRVSLGSKPSLEYRENKLSASRKLIYLLRVLGWPVFWVERAFVVNEGSGKEPKGPLSQDPANVAWPGYPPPQPHKPARQGAICHHHQFPGEHPQGSSFLACRGPSSQRLPQGRWRTSPHGVTLRIWPALKGISPCVAGLCCCWFPA